MAEINITHWLPLSWNGKLLSARSVGWTFLFMSILSGATYNAFAKELSHALSPLSLVFMSEALTAFFVLFSFGTLPTLRHLLTLPRQKLLPVLAVSILTSVIAPFLWFAGLEETTAVNASLFGYADNLFLIILAVFVLHEDWNRAHVTAMIFIALGVTIVAVHGFESGLKLQGGDMLILLAGLAFSIGGIIFRKYLHHTEPQIVIFVRSAVAISAFFLISPFLPHPFISEVAAFPMVLLPALLGFGFISRFLHVFSFYASIERLPIATVSLFSALGIVAAPLFARLSIGESEELLWYHFLGGAMILLGTILLELLGFHPSQKHHLQHLRQRAHHRP